jgi:hypothetical protein
MKRPAAKKKPATKRRSQKVSGPASESLPEMPDQKTLATLAALIAKGDEEPERAVGRAWRFLKAAEKIINGERAALIRKTTLFLNRLTLKKRRLI